MGGSGSPSQHSLKPMIDSMNSLVVSLPVSLALSLILDQFLALSTALAPLRATTVSGFGSGTGSGSIRVEDDFLALDYDHHITYRDAIARTRRLHLHGHCGTVSGHTHRRTQWCTKSHGTRTSRTGGSTGTRTMSPGPPMLSLWALRPRGAFRS